MYPHKSAITILRKSARKSGRMHIWQLKMQELPGPYFHFAALAIIVWLCLAFIILKVILFIRSCKIGFRLVTFGSSQTKCLVGVLDKSRTLPLCLAVKPFVPCLPTHPSHHHPALLSGSYLEPEPVLEIFHILVYPIELLNKCWVIMFKMDACDSIFPWNSQEFRLLGDTY